ncbi:MAG: hypothetical protein KBD06_00885 [Candidatus Pacebacteria bacterium]|nr:hypothetical protein [Candidatus Paceibacterota bacterium]
MALRTGRHYVGNFDLPNQSAAPVAEPQPRPPTAIPASEVRIPRAAPPARVRMGEHHVPARQGPSERRVAPPIERAPIPRDESYKSPDERLTGLQKEILAALDQVEFEVGADIMLEARNVVRGNLKRTTIVPTTTEREIFHRIGVPGY